MLVMGYGLCNALDNFTHLIKHVQNPFIHQIVIIYLDDICIYSKSPEERLNHIRQALTALRKYALFIRMFEGFSAKRETKYLGFIVGNGNV